MSPFNTRSLISPSYPTSKSESFDDEVKEKKYPTSKSESFDDEVKEKKIELMIRLFTRLPQVHSRIFGS